MKSLISIILILTASACFAQTGKDTTSKAALKQKDIKNQKIEKLEEIPLKTETTVIGNPQLYKILSETEYYQDLKKPLLKDVFENNLKTKQDIISDNMQGILSDVRKANEDKRSPFLKAVESALGVAQVAVVSALAVREIVREVERKPKK